MKPFISLMSCLIAVATAVSVGPSLAEDRDFAPYRFSSATEVPPILTAIPTNSVGVARLPDYGDHQITVYSESLADKGTKAGSVEAESSKTKYYYQPYIALETSKLSDVYRRRCQNGSARTKFHLDFTIEIGSTAVASTVARQYGVSTGQGPERHYLEVQREGVDSDGCDADFDR